MIPVLGRDDSGRFQAADRDDRFVVGILELELYRCAQGAILAAPPVVQAIRKNQPVSPNDVFIRIGDVPTPASSLHPSFSQDFHPPSIWDFNTIRWEDFPKARMLPKDDRR
jgi:hypothetical protein